MVPITKGDRLLDVDNFVVLSDSGEYGDFDLILCGDPSSSAESAMMYQAQFVRYGGLVYRFETPETLGEALIAIDPKSTHDAAQLFREDEERRVKREKGTLEPENPVEAPDAVTPTTASEEPTREQVRARRAEEKAYEEERIAEQVKQDALIGGDLVEEEEMEFVPEPPPEVLAPLITPELPAFDLSSTTPE